MIACAEKGLGRDEIFFLIHDVSLLLLLVCFVGPFVPQMYQ